MFSVRNVVTNGLALTFYIGQKLGRMISPDEKDAEAPADIKGLQKSFSDGTSLIITLFGFSGAGKTCFYKRITEAFYHNFSPTIGVDAFQSEFLVRDNDAISSQKVKVRIHDICGQLYRSLPLLVSVLQHAHGFLVVIDSTKSIETCEKNVQELLEMISEIKTVHPPCILFVLSKIDSDDARISCNDMEEVLKHMKNDYEFKCIETSAKVDININIAVKNLVQMVYNRNIKNRDIYRFYEEPGMTIYMEKKQMKQRNNDIEKTLESQMKLMQSQIDQQMKLIKAQMNQIQQEIDEDPESDPGENEESKNDEVTTCRDEPSVLDKLSTIQLSNTMLSISE